jgi:hypothetical protein
MSLVFDHSLRIRLKAEADAKSASAPVSVANSAPGSPKASDTLVKDSGFGDEGDSDTVHSRSATAASTATVATTSTVVPPASVQTTAADVKKADPVTEPKEKQEKKSNLVGKINNLMTSDLANITAGRDFLFLGAIFLISYFHCAKGSIQYYRRRCTLRLECGFYTWFSVGGEIALLGSTISPLSNLCLALSSAWRL